MCHANLSDFTVTGCFQPGVIERDCDWLVAEMSTLASLPSRQPLTLRRLTVAFQWKEMTAVKGEANKLFLFVYL